MAGRLPFFEMFYLYVMVNSIKVQLQELLNKVISAEKADKGNIQLFNQQSGDLQIVAYSGFEESFIQHFLSVKPFDPTACGRAFGIGSTVFINDIETDIAYKSNRAAANTAGYRAVKSVPVYNSMNKCVGVISTHFRDAKTTWEATILVNLLPIIADTLDALTIATKSQNIRAVGN